MIHWAIIDDLPKEFSDKETVSLHRNKKEAKLFLTWFKGLGGDSYSCQYYALEKRKGELK